MRTASHHPIHPQHGPALALADLTATFPDLPIAMWRIEADGTLQGAFHDNARTAAIAYSAALQAPLTKPSPYQFEGGRRVAQHLRTSWAGVQVEVSFYSDAAAYPELLLEGRVAA